MSRTQTLHSWMTNNCLKLNEEKTELILVRAKCALHKIDDIDIVIAGTKVSISECAKYLGVYFNHHLSPEPHTRHIITIPHRHLQLKNQLQSW